MKYFEDFIDEFDKEREDFDKYSNKKLLNYSAGPIIWDKNYFEDLKYFVEKMCGPSEINDEIEARRHLELQENLSEFSLALYCFKENFSHWLGKDVSFSKIENYGLEGLVYLENTYPFCFFLNGNISFKNLDSALLFYAKMQGATKEELEQIIPMLKKIPFKNGKEDTNICSLEYQDDYYVYCNQVVGTTVSYYQADNLYDTLVSLDDKMISRYMSYLAINNVFVTPDKVMNKSKPSCYLDTEGNLLVEEGNHRIMTYRAMIAIKAFINRTKDHVIYRPFEVNLIKARKKINKFH